MADRARAGAVLAAVIILGWGCSGDARSAEAPAGVADGAPEGLFAVVPASAPEIEGNPATAEKVELGRMLFFEPRLSASGLISCNSCHNLGTGGVDLLETSVGHGWQKGPRNAPTVLNAVYNGAQFWDGRAPDLAEQAKGPMQASVEMNSRPERVLATLRSIPEYVSRFEAVFPDASDPVTFDNVALAIESFEATLVTPDAPFDRYLRGDADALTELEEQGLALFTEKGCASCHGGINVGGSGYHRFGVAAHPGEDILPAADRGREAVTGDPEDAFVFRTPTLRNIELTGPYFHSGAVWGLDEAVRVMARAQLGIELPPAEVEAIVAFLGSLTGTQPQVEFPILPPSTETTPRPDLTLPAPLDAADGDAGH